MPLPWKKSKVTRISQLVADLQSPNRGGSLVVETGFPNSLIDLFVKNRDRLKKQKPLSSKRKKRINHNSNQVEISDRAILPPPSQPPPPPSCGNSDKFWGPAVSRIESFGCRQSCVDVDKDDLFVEDDQVVVLEKNHVKKSDLSGIFVAIMKILIVVVLAMATKKLAVGITLSASALLFIEYVGKRMVCFFEPCLKMLSSSKFLIRRVEIVDESKSCTIDEIEIGDSMTDLVIANEAIRYTEPDSDTLNCDERLGHEETVLRMRDFLEEDEETMEHKNRRRSRGAKFKAKVMKKLAPKKEKKCRERETESSIAVFNYTGVEKLSILEEQGNELVKEIEIDENKSSHSLSSEQNQGEKQEIEEEEKMDDDGGRSSSREILMATSTPIVSEKTGMKKKRNLRSLILILLILAGLVGGRSIALVLTFGWWLCLKSVGSLKRQSNVPMIGFLLSKFSEE